MPEVRDASEERDHDAGHDQRSRSPRALPTVDASFDLSRDLSRIVEDVQVAAEAEATQLAVTHAELRARALCEEEVQRVRGECHQEFTAELEEAARRP